MTSLAAAGFDRPDRYYGGNSWRVALRREIVLDLLGGYRPTRILDLGCGDAGISASLPRRHLTAVDASPGMVELARARHGPDVETIQSDLHEFRGAAAYDLILCLGVLAHVPSTQDVFAAIARNSAPGTHLLVQMSAGPVAWLHHFCSLFRRYRPRPTPWRDVLKAAREHGFEPIAEQRHLLTVPAMAKIVGPLLLPYDRFVRRHRVLSRWGAERIVLFVRHG